MDSIQYFTWGQLLYNEVFNLISCISMALNILNIALIKNCFLGKRLNFTKKTIYKVFIIVPLFLALFIFGSLITLIENGWDFQKPVMVDNSLIIRGIIVKVLIFLVCFYVSFDLYEKRRLLHTIGYYLYIIIFEFYFEVLIMYSMAYFSEDKVSVINSMVNLNVGDNIVYNYVISYFVIIFLLFLLLYYGFFLRHKYIYISWGYRIVFLVWVFVIGMFPMIPIAQESEEKMYRLMGYGIGVMIPLLVLGVPAAIISVVSRRFAVEKAELQEEYITSELEYINQYKKSQLETRAFRHDIINNLSLLRMLMENGKDDEAKEHLESLLGSIKALSPKYSTGDEMLDCIVSMKASVMEEHNISFSVEGVVDGGLNMKPAEICSLFANALDNAIEACEKIVDTEKRKIDMIIKRTDSFFNIRVENTFVPRNKGMDGRIFEGGEQYTSKENKNIHGYGALNMKQIVSKYDGMIKAETKDNLFILTIVIPRIK